jgi:hypothetical protein
MGVFMPREKRKQLLTKPYFQNLERRLQSLRSEFPVVSVYQSLDDLWNDWENHQQRLFEKKQEMIKIDDQLKNLSSITCCKEKKKELGQALSDVKACHSNMIDHVFFKTNYEVLEKKFRDLDSQRKPIQYQLNALMRLKSIAICSQEYIDYSFVNIISCALDYLFEQHSLKSFLSCINSDTGALKSKRSIDVSGSQLSDEEKFKLLRFVDQHIDFSIKKRRNFYQFYHDVFLFRHIQSCVMDCYQVDDFLLLSDNSLLVESYARELYAAHILCGSYHLDMMKERKEDFRFDRAKFYAGLVFFNIAKHVFFLLGFLNRIGCYLPGWTQRPILSALFRRFAQQFELFSALSFFARDKYTLTGYNILDEIPSASEKVIICLQSYPLSRSMKVGFGVALLEKLFQLFQCSLNQNKYDCDDFNVTLSHVASDVFLLSVYALFVMLLANLYDRSLLSLAKSASRAEFNFDVYRSVLSYGKKHNGDFDQALKFVEQERFTMTTRCSPVCHMACRDFEGLTATPSP